MNLKNAIYGGIIGDMVGSLHEWRSYNLKDKVMTFPFWTGRAWQPFTHDANRKGSKYTDDTVTGLAIADALLSMTAEDMQNDDKVREKFADSMKSLCPKYEWAGFGSMFWNWLNYPKGTAGDKPYNSYGNGSGMRVFPIGLAFDTLEETRRMARLSAEVTHNHPEGIKGAESVASAMFLARTGAGKEEIRKYIESEFDYDLDRTCDEIRPDYAYEITCQLSVPESIICFLGGNSFEECVRLAVSLGGDADTMGCMAGAMAACVYPIPEKHLKQAKLRLNKELYAIAEQFSMKWSNNND